MKNNALAIQLHGVGKRYTIHHEKPTLVEKLITAKTESFWALKDINLEIPVGGRVGIVGPNGSGKTTILKLISGITAPTTGTIKTRGNVVSLIDLGAGFHPDLTGEQNIYLQGMILGMDKRTIAKRVGHIIAFADIGRFIDTPLYTYSDGMKLRLGFAIAVHAEPDILLLDETLTAGDRDFQIKSQKKITELFKRGITIVVVSHWLEFIEEYCTRVLVIHGGNVVRDGDLRVLSAYRRGIL